MFRTGHRTDPSPSLDLPAPRATVESNAVEPPAVPTVERPAARPAERSEAILGRGVAFDGTLRFTGTLRIEGSFKGQILSGDSLVIGDGADVNADISCGSINVTGEARGSLTATRAIELHAPASVTADVTTPSLIVGEGVLLDGTVRMRGAPARAVRHDRPTRPPEDSSA
ncbi:MAG TPA: polymer-forming cytoskeletal protein [Chloroflexi bacterium]|jgi:cytoskeletal protein CcmA (bactofilin family)|nr:polymer-forming cytoskeletal protein [Chloroflexota bacterium]HAL27480.1 polymer-forming cytoskeletal protein [Chloroflexota bacterium]